ncbi:hypothetical protein Pla108_17860 [Botrimarina colliarenosi]|uniref:Ice-binding protein C-terminal domain-containing protein n=1 Tax=Botrimarina colliarenosi TaxID=2528001 RepID=A0A5C6AC91_9BACT|nr:PEP-CTERM sorting domain-containing protein [Botrimarina colliarenosi]TWT97634.1 hypothetical protein Pla108_17860 [Botrimarina colliarenosi]
MKNSRLFRVILSRVAAATVVGVFSLGSGAAAQETLYADSFSGTGPLNGVLVESGGLQNGSVAWGASSAFNADGTINGADEGGAYLPFQPLVNSVYTLSMNVTNTTDRWIALGFTRDAIGAPGASDLNDRMSNETEGIAWMLYRNNGAANAVESFAGLRTLGGLALDTTGLDFNANNELEIQIDTTGDGSSFTADWRINGASLRNEVVNIPVTDINFVGLSFDNATTGVPTFDNFLLTGPLTLFGDVDGDGDVDGVDFGFIRDNLFLAGALRTQGDLTGDGTVDFADYRQWKDAAGPALASQFTFSVPEPASVLLMVLVGLGSVGGSRRRA